MTDTYLVSACLVGTPCRFDGGSCSHARVDAFLRGKDTVAFCPEQAGGLPTPRLPAELQMPAVAGGPIRVMDSAGADVTRAFTTGAALALRRAEQVGANVALLKARSPSCGSKQVYDGTFARTLVAGEGVTAAVLRHAGLRILNEEEC